MWTVELSETCELLSWYLRGCNLFKTNNCFVAHKNQPFRKVSIFKSLFETKMYTTDYFKMRNISTGAKLLLMSIFYTMAAKRSGTEMSRVRKDQRSKRAGTERPVTETVRDRNNRGRNDPGQKRPGNKK